MEGIEINQNIIGILIACFLLAGYIPYIKSALLGTNTPHFFTFFAWSLIIAVVLLTQVVEGSGMGTAPLIVSLCCCILVSCISYKSKSRFSFTISDKLFLSVALISVPLWYFTNNALWAVIWLSISYCASYIPTFRKTYIYPYSENLSPHVMGFISYGLSIFCIETYKLSTLIYPVSLSFMMLLFILMVMIRRRLSFNYIPIRYEEE
jgi:hypothetical protein